MGLVSNIVKYHLLILQTSHKKVKGLSQNEAALFYEKSNARSCADMAAFV
jgi:hypothetical protein